MADRGICWRVTILACVGLFTGCAGVQQAMTYNGIEVTRFEYGEDTWRIFDDRDRNRMMTSPSLGATIGTSTVRGLTLGIADLDPEGLHHQAMVRAYLDQTGREACAITETKLVLRPQYEHFYTCSGGQ